MYKRLSNFEKYDTIYATKKLKLFSNFYIPVELIECNNSEIKEYEVNYTEEEAKQEAKRRAEERLKIQNNEIDMLRAQAALLRAITRFHVKGL